MAAHGLNRDKLTRLCHCPPRPRGNELRRHSGQGPDAIAPRGRGETDTTIGHSLEDESLDVVALIQSIGELVFLLGHSYGAQTALAAAAQVPDRIRKLVIYEAPWPHDGVLVGNRAGDAVSYMQAISDLAWTLRTYRSSLRSRGLRGIKGPMRGDES